MGGLLVDVAAIASVVAFGVAGAALGLVRSSVRLVSTLLALVIALLLVGALGGLLDRIGLSVDLANLVALTGVSVAVYLACGRIYDWYSGWTPHARLERADRWLGAVPGAVLGMAWTSLMVATLTLAPTTTFLSSWPIQSRAGHLLINHASDPMKWIENTFPHYAQTLPKGKRGAVVTPTPEIVLGADPALIERPDDAGRLLANINDARIREDRAPFTWNQELAGAATRHSRTMLADAWVGTTSPTGTKFSDRMRLALGSNASLYCRYGSAVAWAHGVPNAYAALMADPDLRDRLLSPRFLEVGIGAVDGGWFDGRMYTIALVGERLDPATVQDTEQECKTLRRARSSVDSSAPSANTG